VLNRKCGGFQGNPGLPGTATAPGVILRKRMNRRYLAIDLGAESGRAMLANFADHKLELHELHRFPNTPVSLPTGLYWDTLRIFHEMCEGLRLSARHTDQLDGIAVDTWGVDFGLLGPEGALIDNPRHYRDARTHGVPEQLFKVVPRHEVFRETGIQVMEINSLYQLYAIHLRSPWLLDAAHRLLFMPDLFNYFLTGVECSERTIASTSQFYNPVTKVFATDMLRRLGITASFLGNLVDPGTHLGPVLPYIAGQSHLNYDTPVYTVGGHDTASAVAAVPTEGGDAWCYISSGTWSLMGVELDSAVMTEQTLKANFTNEVGVARKIRFLKNIAGLWLIQECRRAWAREGMEYTYAELMDLAFASKPLETVIDPDTFYEPGNHPRRIRQCCRDTGQAVPEDPGSLCRVILYSLAVRYKEVLETIESLTGRRIAVIHIVGGGSRNRLLNQLAADVTGRRVVAGPAEATAAGNALTQAMGAGDLSSLEEIREVVRRSFTVEEFHPRAVPVA
jgi:rhamnulokinase